MESKKQMLMLRQGDVLICRVHDVPSGIAPVKRDKRGVILAEGEATGHFHGITARHAKLYRTEEDVRFLRVGGTAPVELRHQEHTTVPIPPGDYRVTIHTQYVPGELPRNVED